MQSTEPIAIDLVLIGGGHSHAIVLKKWGMNPIPGVRLTLITDVFHTPYSGMLPGYVAGLYRFDDCHIDLRPLTQFAQARLIPDRAIALDLKNNRVICENRPPIAFDWLSIDIGSTPSVAQVPGAREYAIAVKPISHFLQQWDQLIEAVKHQPYRPLQVGIVGGGAGGVELTLNVQARLQAMLGDRLKVHLFHRGQELLEAHSRSVRSKIQQTLLNRGVRLHLGESVSEVKPDLVRCESGLTVECDRLFWVTQASATPWIRESGLATDEQGFIQIDDSLRSISHPRVFAAGDIATMVNYPRPKAGVFAVRQGKPLYENLRRAVLNQPLQTFHPQQKYLALIGLGDRTAIASRGNFGFGAAYWLWNWKDAIDRKFMDQFADLESMGDRGSGVPSERFASRDQEAGKGLGIRGSFRALREWGLGNVTQRENPSVSSVSKSVAMRCAGCGSKIGSSVLEKAIDRLRKDHLLPNRDDVLIGLDSPDDAAVVQVPAGQVMVQTIDYFRALIDDPFLFGQIAANHCLSDLFAMGATPQSAMAIATLPNALDTKQEETLYQLLAGAARVLLAAKASLIGGHTTEGTELAFGLSCNGLAQPDRLLKKSGMKPGQALILTKPIGTGTLFAADMHLQAKGRWIEGAIRSMLQSNQAAALCFQKHGATACTDITGFGLIGHLAEMTIASQVAVELALSEIPILDGALDTIAQGFLSSLHPQNVKADRHITNASTLHASPRSPLLFDPQTSGGLLASLPQDQAIECLKALKAIGYPHSAIIGHTNTLQGDHPPITIEKGL